MLRTVHGTFKFYLINGDLVRSKSDFLLGSQNSSTWVQLSGLHWFLFPKMEFALLTTSLPQAGVIFIEDSVKSKNGSPQTEQGGHGLKH